MAVERSTQESGTSITGTGSDVRQTNPTIINPVFSGTVTQAAGAGTGGTVTQLTSGTTGVTLNKRMGTITTVALTTAAGAETQFTVTNSIAAITDVVAISSTYNGAGTPSFSVINQTAGTFDIVITNLHASAAFNAAVVMNFIIHKVVTS